MKKDDEELAITANEAGEEKEQHSGYVVPDIHDEEVKHHLGGFYQNWFLDYASYVIIDRAVPYIEDGLKPVQRRILHTMRQIDDGKFNKVANISGQVMQYHPHGDASINEALTALGRKDLLIDCQGSWGNILTGDGAAAARYIEGRLSKFALEVCFSPKVTEWKLAYDGRKEEPVTLPIKFPLLLAQGANGIAVGLSTYILPHNFCELLDASVAALKGEEFQLYPDFQTGAMIDVQKYNDGARGGYVRIRSHITKQDNKTLVITDLPYGVTTESLKESITKASEKGKISVKKIDDLTSSSVQIVLNLNTGASSDKTIDALYAFTDCEVKLWTNCCVIKDKTPIFTTVSEVLKSCANRTMEIFRQEMEIEKAELLEKLHFCSLEKIFIEERIYEDKEFKNATSVENAMKHTAKRLEPFLHLLVRPITDDDVARLMEIKMKRIIKYSADEADKIIADINGRIKEIDHHLKHLVDFTIKWFEHLKEKYGAGRERKTEIKTFDNVVAAKVVEANEKLYVNRAEGYVGTSLKKDEFVCPCSDMDDILVIFKDGKYVVKKVKDKDYVGKNILYVNVFKKNDKRMVYNVVYRDGKVGATWMKRFAITGVTRDKEYDITMGTAGSRILYFTANKNAEAEVIQVQLEPRKHLKVGTLVRDFASIAIKGRQSRGNKVTENKVIDIRLKQRGSSTMGGRKVWFDPDVKRLNYDAHGNLLGEFQSEDRILVITRSGEYYLSTFEDTVHFPDDLMMVEKYNPDKVWTVCLFDASEGYDYIKRFVFEPTSKQTSFLGDNPKSEMLLITSTAYPRIQLTFGGKDAERAPMEIDAEEFIGVKGYKAKGKRLATWIIDSITELEPTRFPEEPEPSDEPEPNDAEPEVDDANVEEVQIENGDGQLSIF